MIYDHQGRVVWPLNTTIKPTDTFSSYTGDDYRSLRTSKERESEQRGVPPPRHLLVILVEDLVMLS